MAGVSYDVEYLCDKRISARGDVSYLVKWLGYPHAENTWEPHSFLSNSYDLVSAYERNHSRVRYDLRRRPPRAERSGPQPSEVVFVPLPPMGHWPGLVCCPHTCVETFPECPPTDEKRILVRLFGRGFTFHWVDPDVCRIVTRPDAQKLLTGQPSRQVRSDWDASVRLSKMEVTEEYAVGMPAENETYDYAVMKKTPHQGAKKTELPAAGDKRIPLVPKEEQQEAKRQKTTVDPESPASVA